MKGKTGEDFDRAYENLSKAEKALYKNKIEGNTECYWWTYTSRYRITKYSSSIRFNAWEKTS